MELNQYLVIFKKHFIFIASFAILGSFFAFLLGSKLPSGYRAEQLFYIVDSQPAKEAEILPSYYSQEKARNFTDTAVAILSSPDFANYQSPVSARKIAPQIIRLTATANDPQTAQNLVEKASINFNQKLRNSADLNSSLEIRAVGKSMPPTDIAISPKIALFGGFIIGLILAIFVVALKTYFKL